MRPPTPPKAVWIAIAAFGTVAVVRGQPETRSPTLPAGTVLVAALEHSVSTVDARAGDPVALRTVHAVRIPDGGVIPVGSVIRGQVTHVVSGQGRRTPELLLQFSAIDIADDRYAIASVTFHVEGRSRPWLAPAARGPAGTAVRSGSAIATDGRELTLPAGRRLSVRLTAPVEVRYRVPGDTHQLD